MATHFVHNRRARGKASMQRSMRFPVEQPATSTGTGESEADVQRAVLALLEKHPAVAFHWRTNTASGFLVSAKDWKSLLAGAVAKRTMARFIKFAFPGCSDILGMLKTGQFLAIECKARDGEPTEDQVAFIQRVNHYGGVGLFARSVDDVIRRIPLSSHP